MSDDEQKEEDLEEAVDEIKQKFGEGSIMKLEDIHAVDVDVIPTGSLNLDLALGVRGIPRGRLIEIFGPEASGKTTLALHVTAEAQKQGGTAAYIDAEHALDPQYAKKIGVDIENLLISQPNSGEQALEILESLVRSEAIDLAIIDSVAALTPQKEIAGEMEDDQVALQARLMSKAMRKLSGIVSDTRTSVIFLNQTRMKIGVTFGDPTTTPGGKALKFYSSVRIKLNRKAKIKEGDEITGNRVKAKVVKNKVAAPFRTAVFDIFYNQGISQSGDLIRTGTKYDVIERAGSWYKLGDEKLGQGKSNARDYLEENPDVAEEIEEEIIKTYKEESGLEEEDEEEKDKEEQEDEEDKED
ncbi:MAG: recombinase RecA [Candidatus Paceibacterota bacterium]